MILFVFEGQENEPNIYNAIKDICSIQDDIVCTYNTSIHSLYKKISEQDWDLFLTLTEVLRKRGDNTLDSYKAADIAQTFLFFDYDLHDKHIPLEQLNREIKEMLAFFNEETENGKLYINYPMLESIRYTKQLPDSNYHTYVVKRQECCNFKCIASKFSHYADYSFLLPVDANGRINQCAKENWEHLRVQNVCKANLICNDTYDIPTKKDAITQEIIFQSQVTKYLNVYDVVAILNSFPLFIFEYFK